MVVGRGSCSKKGKTQTVRMRNQTSGMTRLCGTAQNHQHVLDTVGAACPTSHSCDGVGTTSTAGTIAREAKVGAHTAHAHAPRAFRISSARRRRRHNQRGGNSQQHHGTRHFNRTEGETRLGVGRNNCGSGAEIRPCHKRGLPVFALPQSSKVAV